MAGTRDTSTTSKPKKHSANPIPTYSGSTTKPHYSLPGGASSSTDSSDTKTPPKTGGGSTAESRAIARENDAKRKAAAKYNEQAANLEAQARALRHALKIDFSKSLHQQLSDIGQILGQQQSMVREGYRLRVHQLEGAVEDNEKATAAQSGINQQNLIRERTSAMSQAMDQGAGESDLLKTQMMSLRNWNANQNEITRSYFDTLRSTNQSLTDLNVDTKTALMNNAIQANSDREQAWTNYFNQKSEAYTQLGNVRGQQGDDYANAREMAPGSVKSGKKGHKVDLGKQAQSRSAAAFMNAAKMEGRSWDNPGVPKGIRHWQGHDDFAPAETNVSKLQNVQTTQLDKHPEGATLRKWG